MKANVPAVLHQKRHGDSLHGFPRAIESARARERRVGMAGGMGWLSGPAFVSALASGAADRRREFADGDGCSIVLSSP